MAAWVDIGATELGSSVRGKLNTLAGDVEISFRVVSAIAQIAEITYFTTGTIVYAVAERVFYKYNGAAWVQDNTLPTGTYTKVTEIDDGDSPYTLLGTDAVVIADTTAGDVTINLTALSGIAERKVEFKNIGTGTLTLDGNASEVIDSSLTLALSQWESAELVATSARWVIM
jgi:hypothetical protein